ncbi:MAG: hypothetical protein OXC14_04015 [Rhodospirillaceae bacterium]|nr:hypothetical protein [Rhodospirillaceae bacterium]
MTPPRPLVTADQFASRLSMAAGYRLDLDTMRLMDRVKRRDLSAHEILHWPVVTQHALEFAGLAGIATGTAERRYGSYRFDVESEITDGRPVLKIRVQHAGGFCYSKPDEFYDAIAPLICDLLVESDCRGVERAA